MSRSVFFLVAGWVLVSSAPLTAQDAVLGQIYGNGVHAYFAQDYLKAHQLFTSAIDGHTPGPALFLFPRSGPAEIGPAAGRRDRLPARRQAGKFHRPDPRL